jgi:nicotinamide mononucleotide (NMN) deamidase PncC
MPAQLEMALIVIPTVLLVLVSGLAGALWWRVRSQPIFDALQLAEVLAARLRTLEQLLARLESEAGGAGAAEVRPGRGAAVAKRKGFSLAAEMPKAHEDGVGPTLIAVPDLAEASHSSPAPAAAELGQRFGTIWELATTGASAEQIARRTGQPVGQVELILGLRRQLETAGAGSKRT